MTSELPDAEQRRRYAAMYVLKQMDLAATDGGTVFPVVLPSELSPLDELLSDLAVDELVAIDAKKGCYALTKAGSAYLEELIDEAEALIDEFDDAELDETIRELRARRLDPFRARFLWGWYDGEFDDLVAFQERRGVRPVERLWAFYLTSEAFYRELARELEEA